MNPEVDDVASERGAEGRWGGDGWEEGGTFRF